MAYIKSAVSSAYIHLQPKLGLHGQLVLQVFDADKETVVVIDLPRTELLAALGAVDAPVEVPKNLGTVIGYKGQTYVRHAQTDFEGWSASDATLNSDDDMATILKDGGTILSEGVEL